jgi:hypothetical protein
MDRISYSNGQGYQKRFYFLIIYSLSIFLVFPGGVPYFSVPRFSFLPSPASNHSVFNDLIGFISAAFIA